MQFAVFPQQVLPAHLLRSYVPDSHKLNLSLYQKGFSTEKFTLPGNSISGYFYDSPCSAKQGERTVLEFIVPVVQGSLEAKEFSYLKKNFEAEDAVILGVSKDSPESHKRFIEKKELTIKLLSDKQADSHKAYDVLHPKRLRGKEVTGTVRTTFLINPEGKIIKTWNNVKAAGHAEQVFLELKLLKENKM